MRIHCNISVITRKRVICKIRLSFVSFTIYQKFKIKVTPSAGLLGIAAGRSTG